MIIAKTLDLEVRNPIMSSVSLLLIVFISKTHFPDPQIKTRQSVDFHWFGLDKFNCNFKFQSIKQSIFVKKEVLYPFQPICLRFYNASIFAVTILELSLNLPKPNHWKFTDCPVSNYSRLSALKWWLKKNPPTTITFPYSIYV